MKILVTGCAGFIGCNLAKQLVKNNIKVVGVDNFFPNYDVSLKRKNIAPLLESGLLEFIEGDINDPALFEGLSKKSITHIVHLAARTGVRDSSKYAGEYLKTNIIGSLNVLNFARGNKIKAVVMASTSSVYGKNKTPFNEGQKISTPLSVYAASKIAMENLAYSFNHLHGIPITVLRFFTVYGPGGRPDMAVYGFAERISKGERIEVFGDGKAERDFTYVSDAVGGILLALEKTRGFSVFNIGNSGARSVSELIMLLEKSLGKKAKITFSGKRKEDVENTLADISMARKTLGFSPKVGLEEGIKLFAEWFKKR
ncbi:MAG TPA: NAD-dependent epimerase/dehydratase family protein [archaeon]|nr:NAD-dependent epimerase/dehydratase family protein [archaeon]